jgi:hypothetical protein
MRCQTIHTLVQSVTLDVLVLYFQESAYKVYSPKKKPADEIQTQWWPQLAHKGSMKIKDEAGAQAGDIDWL